MKRPPDLNKLWLWAVGGVSIVAVMLAIALRDDKLLDPAQAAPNTMVVFKSATCECCSKWVEHLQKAGFAVEVHDESSMDVLKRKLGVPEALASCHTGFINGYVIEGHVPAEDIRRLLVEKPKAKGLALPGMPMGSPGMEMADQREPYETQLFLDDGQSSVFSKH